MINPTNGSAIFLRKYCFYYTKRLVLFCREKPCAKSVRNSRINNKHVSSFILLLSIVLISWNVSVKSRYFYFVAEILQRSENIYYEFVRNLELLRSFAYFFRTFLPNMQTTELVRSVYTVKCFVEKCCLEVLSKN